ncbi:DUF4271 domain-containing protein [Flavobacterium cellulosilyticum]|uniref:DUF4271 domain-containing protein n=1 Tax=Flavobacterium cellulosilyticum TaxID=2541731 RepID=A0A4R5CLK9_9FLAO|nr:DUF4271 domain-containing protein [Flavobacterium cellulosilyticum]TDD99273.1 DUF4271 domain-containing protein [Flavobacterium cellulosilyticum]
MTENVLHLREIENRDWAIIIFVLSFATIAIVKSAFENRFADFAKLIYSDKYTNVYKDSSNLKSGFTIALFFVQIISLTFFIQISLSIFGFASKTDWIVYIQIFTFLVFFTLSKFLIEKIIATAFDIEEFMEQYNLQKVVFRTYIGLILLPINIFLFYHDTISINILTIIIVILLSVNVLVYFVSIKNYQNIIYSKLFYFILYLCALEIAPYYFMYYLFTKGIA